MELLKTLIMPISGAIIGYFTNWLAIKMLFRPYTEKKIFGIKLPFTPGIIPKERETLARKVGETVSKHLLTDEMLTNAINSENTKKKIDGLVDFYIEKITEKDYAIDDILELTLKENKESAISKIEESFFEKSKYYFAENGYENKIKDMVFTKSITYLEEKKIGAISEKIFKILSVEIDKYINSYIESGKLKDFIIEKSDLYFQEFTEKNYCIKDFLSKEKVQPFEELIKEKLPLVPEIIENFLIKNPDIEEKIKQIIYNIIDESTNTFVLIFVSRQKIYETIKTSAIDYFKDEQNQNIALEKLNSILDDLLSKNINDVILKLDPEMIENLKLKVINIFIESLNMKTFDKSSEFLQKKIDSYKNLSILSIIKKVNPNFEFDFKNIIDSNFQIILKESISEIKFVYENLKSNILDIKINTYMKNIETYKPKIYFYINTLVEKFSSSVAESIEIEKIVEEQINSFEVEEAEGIILSVVNKELKAITILGGVLGFAIGLLTMLF